MIFLCSTAVGKLKLHLLLLQWLLLKYM